MIEAVNITAGILAGGQGRRMGGVDKGLLSFSGRLLIRHVIDAIKYQTGTILISINRHDESYSSLGYPLVHDLNRNFSGPVAGISSLLAKAGTPYVLIVPCDTPYLPGDLVVRLAKALISEKAQVAVAYGDGRLQPLCALLRRDVERELRIFADQGGTKVEQWLLGLSYTVVDFRDRHGAFYNINTREELFSAEALGASIGSHLSKPVSI